MPEQTEQLVSLLAQTTNGRGKATERISEIAYKRTANNHNYRYRVNQVIAKSSTSADGEVIRVQLPAFGAICGEIFIQVGLDALDAGTYDPHVGAKILKYIRLIHSDQFFEIEPKRVWPILLSQMRNQDAKGKRKELFGTGSASASAQTLCIPLLQPWSVHFANNMYDNDGPRYSTRERGLFPAFAIKENVVFELVFEPRSAYTDSASAASTAGPKNVTLLWEEVVAAPDTLEAIKRSIPLAVCAPDFTYLDSNANDGSAETVVNITSLLSKAPTHTLWFDIQENSVTDRDPFNKASSDGMSLQELNCDGRDLISDRDLGAAVKRYLQIVRGRPVGAEDTDPQLPNLSFGNDEGFSVAHAQQQLSNTACNNVTLTFKCKEASVVSIAAQHQRHYEVDQGTLKSSSVY